MGQDGLNDTSNLNRDFAKDAFGYTLGYYSGDYKAISGLKWSSVTNRFEAQTAGGELLNDRSNLYNGNISHMVTTLSWLDTTVTAGPTGAADDQRVFPLAQVYKYDQLNRIMQSKAYNNISIPGNLWQSSGQSVGNMYRNTFTYDANGNILTQVRFKETGTRIDNMVYNYHRDASSNLVRNRLYHVNDFIADGVFNGDIDDHGTFSGTEATINTVNNYRYDEIGNMIADSTEEIDTIKWTVYGKIKEIKRTSGSTKENMLFDYDASGNRVAKHILTSANAWKHSTYYVRDAQGNVMSVYKQDTVGAGLSYKWQEQDLYGSSRIGMFNPDKELIGFVPDSIHYSDTLGKKIFEGVNHLSNVLTTFSDRKIDVDLNLDRKTDLRVADVLSSTDYYPFGWTLPKRICFFDTLYVADDRIYDGNFNEEHDFSIVADGNLNLNLTEGRLEVETVGSGNGASSPHVTVVPDSTYIVSFYVDPGDCADTILVRIRDKHGVVVDSMFITVAGTYSMVYTPLYNAFSIEFVSLSESGCTFYIDNVEVEGTSPQYRDYCDVGNSGYKYGFNGKENDDEAKGSGSQQDYGARIYDPRLGKFLTIDPLTDDYPFYSPYQFAGNTPIRAIDRDGLEPAYPQSNGTWSLPSDQIQRPITDPTGLKYFENMPPPSDDGSGMSLTLDLIPGVGTVKGWTESAIGSDLVTGEEISNEARVINLIPGGKLLNKGADALKIVTKNGDEVIEQTVKRSDEVGSKPGRTGKQARIKEIADDPLESRANRGWVRNERRRIAFGNGSRSYRMPNNGRKSPGRKAEDKGLELAHPHNAPASKGNTYKKARVKNHADHKVETRLHRRSGRY